MVETIFGLPVYEDTNLEEVTVGELFGTPVLTEPEEGRALTAEHIEAARAILMQNYLETPYIHDTNRASDPVEEVTDIMEKWFDRLEDGTAKNFYPNPKGKKVSPAEADRIIKYIDFEINFELRVYTAWHGNRGHDYPAEYDRLPGVARIAFAQEILEAKERLGIPRGKQTQSQEEEPTGFGGL